MVSCLNPMSKARPGVPDRPAEGGVGTPPDLARALAEAAALQGRRDDVMYLDSTLTWLQCSGLGNLQFNLLTLTD